MGLFNWFSSFRTNGDTNGPKMFLQQLEERIVLDASVAPAADDDQSGNADVGQDGNPDINANATPGQGAGQGSGGDPVAPGQTPDTLQEVFSDDLNVVLISNALGEIEALSEAAVEGAEVIVYDAANDDIESITGLLEDSLADGQQIGQLAILSHGDPGILELGAAQVIGSVILETNPESWMELSSLLAEDARIDLYGCNIGQGEVGTEFVQDLAALTGATVWASDDATGSSPGADWDLEVRSSVSLFDYLIVANALQDSEIVLASNPPTADADGPYYVEPGGIVVLDGSGSTADAAEGRYIVSYLWDLDADGQFDDASGVNWAFPLTGYQIGETVPVSLQVTDDLGYTATGDSVINVIEVTPMADADGPYTVGPGGTVTLDGSGSYHTHPERAIVSYEWDFDSDGNYDDAYGLYPEFLAAGYQIGNSVVVSLRVADDVGENDTSDSVVDVIDGAPTVVLNQPIPQTTQENQFIWLNGTVDDIEPLDELVLNVDWGDGTAEQLGVNNQDGAFAKGHRYLDNDGYTIYAVVTDLARVS
ncbi:DUF4347 domain-containing protein [Thermodesulfobacteriota bacterium]